MSDVKTIRIGKVCVDSGQIMIVDPCYLSDWKANEFDSEKGAENPSGEFSYDGACRETLYSINGGGEIGNGRAVAVGTAYGDGEYPVTARVDSDGRILSITVKFD